VGRTSLRTDALVTLRGVGVGVVDCPPWSRDLIEDWCGEEGGSKGEEEGEGCEWECVFHGGGRWVWDVCLESGLMGLFVV